METPLGIIWRKSKAQPQARCPADTLGTTAQTGQGYGLLFADNGVFGGDYAVGVLVNLLRIKRNAVHKTVHNVKALFNKAFDLSTLKVLFKDAQARQ